MWQRGRGESGVVAVAAAVTAAGAAAFCFIRAEFRMESVMMGGVEQPEKY